MVAPAICSECRAGRHENCLNTWGMPPGAEVGGFGCVCHHAINDDSWRSLLDDAVATAERFGCRECYGDDPDAAWEAANALERTHVLVDDTHTIAQLLRCRTCGQAFLWVTTEVVDWSGGDDAQYRRVVPLTAAEARELAGTKGEPELSMLAELSRGRRYLRNDWRTGRDRPSISWEVGPFDFGLFGG